MNDQNQKNQVKELSKEEMENVHGGLCIGNWDLQGAVPVSVIDGKCTDGDERRVW